MDNVREGKRVWIATWVKVYNSPFDVYHSTEVCRTYADAVGFIDRSMRDEIYIENEDIDDDCDKINADDAIKEAVEECGDHYAILDMSGDGTMFCDIEQRVVNV